MATDLFLVVIGPRLHRGHVISLLRHAPISGFHETRPEIAQMNAKMMAEAEVSFSPIDTFLDGPMVGQRIRSFSVKIQALGLAPSYLLACANTRETVLAGQPEPFLPFVPFVLDAHAINGLTEYVRHAVGGELHERIPAIAKADSFFVKHYGHMAYLCED
jgi:hypothetical protein